MIFIQLPDTFAIVRLPPSVETLRWVTGEFASITKTPDELSIVCKESAVPAGTHADRGWQCLRVEGSMPLTMVGVAAEFTGLLAKAGVSVFVISTFDTDYVLVKGDALERATDALRGGGHSVRRPL